MCSNNDGKGKTNRRDRDLRRKEHLKSLFGGCQKKMRFYLFLSTTESSVMNIPVSFKPPAALGHNGVNESPELVLRNYWGIGFR